MIISSFNAFNSSTACCKMPLIRRTLRSMTAHYSELVFVYIGLQALRYEVLIRLETKLSVDQPTLSRGDQS